MNAIKCNKAYLGDTELELLYASTKFRDLGDYLVGDAVVWDTEKRLFKVAAYEDIPTINTERFIPTGVIAIPSSHDVYGTGEAGVVALRSASTSSPDTGLTRNAKIYWGDKGTDYLELNKYDKVNTISLDQTNLVIESQKLTTAYLPSDSNVLGILSLDGITKHDIKYTTHLPSPYNADGSRNECYFATGPVPTIEPVYGPSQPATIDGLNFNWTVQSGSWNESENSDAKDGKQFTSVGIDNNDLTVIRCTFSGKAGKITFACRYDSNNRDEYLIIGKLDTPCNRSEFGTSLLALSGWLERISFDIPDNGEHYVEFYYTNSGSSANVTGYAIVYIDGRAISPIITTGQSGSGSPENALSDFSGKSNTAFLCSKATAQADWKTANTILNKSNTGYLPAACACWRYHTMGTSQGDWYLPAEGELGYMGVRTHKINETITALQSHFGITLLGIYDVTYLSSSLYGSLYGSNYINGIDKSSSSVCYTSRSYNNFVRPFTRLK